MKPRYPKRFECPIFGTHKIIYNERDYRKAKEECFYAFVTVALIFAGIYIALSL